MIYNRLRCHKKRRNMCFELTGYFNNSWVYYVKLDAGYSTECITHAGRAPSRWAASQRSETAPQGWLVATFCTFWPCDPDPSTFLPFDLIFIGGRGIVMDNLCAKFGNLSFSRFGFIVQTESQRRMIAILTRLPSAWVITQEQLEESAPTSAKTHLDTVYFCIYKCTNLPFSYT